MNTTYAKVHSNLVIPRPNSKLKLIQEQREGLEKRPKGELNREETSGVQDFQLKRMGIHQPKELNRKGKLY